ncbi:MAG: hypothetical protein IJU87_09475 [Lachnospiraceae bacterium]|nr:hypothetical protein [Lachnospiraceae bacterium]
MKRSYYSRLLTILFSLMLFSVLFTGCRMNLPDVHGIGPDGAAADAKGTESAEDTEDGEADGEDVTDEEDNADVTKGTSEDGEYSMTAFVNNSTYFYVDAPEVVLKDKSAAKPVDVKDSAGDLNKARLAYLTSYYEGDETSAKEDLAEYEKADPGSAELDAIKAFYPELGKVFAQFDIANYDFTAPTDADDTEISYDVYSSENEPFTLDFSFDEGAVTDISFSYDGELE